MGDRESGISDVDEASRTQLPPACVTHYIQACGNTVKTRYSIAY